MNKYCAQSILIHPPHNGVEPGSGPSHGVRVDLPKNLQVNDLLVDAVIDELAPPA